ncbi:DUF4328 domain-containing protein [Actinacidiphila glaucinigra]|uniref:DUF4328 domain-containing protein n=1 Tax=Actinacidiphila glaucinigra TaxID=235986 RepID=UPI001FE64DCB|nr:DUF4328 domain-containing protein [Actinacidiphila glaucinigra]
MFRAIELRNHYLHPTRQSLHTSGMVSMVFVYAMTLAIVLFLVWLARARHNAHLLTPQASLPSRGWTIGVWFVPLVNFFAPRQVLLDIGRASSVSWQETRDRTVVNLWWAAWLGHGLALWTAGRIDPASIPLVALAEAFMIAAAALAGTLIERITALQGAALGTPAPLSPVAQS